MIKLQFSRSTRKMIKLQFSRSTELVSLLIAKACRSQFSHVDAVLDDGNLIGASDSPNVPVITSAILAA
jgi:hypothetical protein